MKYVKSLAGLVVTLVLPASATIINNGSFETGDFSGWVTQDLAVPLTPLAVNPAGYNDGYFFLSAPTDGSFAATHGFDGVGPGSIRIGQDILITADQPIITFDYRAAWEISGGLQARLLDVTIEIPGGGPQLANYNILTAAGGTFNLDTGKLVAAVDLSAFSGQTVRFSMDAYVPEIYTGPAFMQIDNVVAIPEPAIIGLLGLVSGGILFTRRIFMV
jgi:hypothetical protein